MKKILYISLLALVPVFFSCVEDLGNDTISDINKITISGIEESYSVISQAETLTITPEIKGSISSNESDLSYEWFLCNNGLSDSEHKHTLIGTERNLVYPANAAPSSYTLYFAVTDKSTGLKWEQSTSLKIVSPMVRGYYLLGDKADGTVGIDFVSMIDGRDNSLVKDIFVNSKGLKGAQDLFFTGYYYNEGAVSLWIVTESGSHPMEHTASMVNVDILPTPAKAEDFIFPTVPVSKPMKVQMIWPRPVGKTNANQAGNARIMATENELFSGSFYSWPEAYGNPMNCYSSGSSDLFKPSKYVFYPKNSTYITGLCFFDETNSRFVRINTNLRYTPAYCVKLTNTGTPFYFDQTQYESVRSLVYGENGYGNAGRCYALMTNAEGEYFVYWMKVPSYSSVTAEAEHIIDMSVATEFAQASHHTFYSMQPIVLYSVGAKLYAYDYIRKECKLINTFDGDITYLKMDYDANDDTNHMLVATYSNGTGKLYSYSVEDNQNAINVTAVQGAEYTTDKKIVKVEYRNSTW